MVYSKEFQEILDSMPENNFIGLGNPNAKILFIGKECGSDVGSIIENGSARSWKRGDIDYSKRFIPEEPNVRNLRHTWQRYQRLYDSILYKLDIKDQEPKKDKYEITFIENVFTTELSNLPAKKAKDAKRLEGFRDELKRRKHILFNSKFIESFQIIVIFANDSKYIETYPGEVCELFKVKFDNIHDYEGKDKIWIHHSINASESPKLLIHTRQLTNSISKGLIDNISDIIADFVKKNAIDIIS